jgi:hypothetical protein
MFGKRKLIAGFKRGGVAEKDKGVRKVKYDSKCGKCKDEDGNAREI